MSVVYFTDRDLGRRFPEILVSGGLDVRRHADHFAPDCPDEEWLKVIGENGWIAVTHDKRIRYKPNELAAVKKHGVALLVIVGKAPSPVLAKHFLDTAPRIEQFLLGKTAPLIAKVYRPTPTDLTRNANAPGTVKSWYP